MNLNNFNPQHFIIFLVVLIIAITIHEFAHAISADKLGDPTPRRDGRISLLPPDHLDPVGTIMMVLSSLAHVGIGWGKPVMVSPQNFKHPKRDMLIVAIAGPISNVLQALVFTLFYRTINAPFGEPIWMFLYAGVLVNLSLAAFNMLPIGPLDGHTVLYGLLPRDAANSYMSWNSQYGTWVFLILVFFGGGILGDLYGPAVSKVAAFLLQ